MNPFLTQQLASQRLRDMHETANRARLIREARDQHRHQGQSRHASTFRRHRTCAA